jgi:hypothetical protein
MLLTARNIVQEITELDLLQKLIHDTSSQYYECPLVITGHSLGAGVAALIACLLRPKIPNICCYSYCPPGATASANLSEYLESFCTSIVVGDDIVTRGSRQTFRLIKHDIKRIISSCDEHKRKIIGTSVKSHVPSLFSSKKLKKEREGILNRKTKDGKLEADDIEMMKRSSFELRLGYQNFPPPLQDGPSMFIPGRIFYFEKIRRPPLKLNEAIDNAFKNTKAKVKKVGERLVKRKNTETSARSVNQFENTNNTSSRNNSIYNADEIVLMPPEKSLQRLPTVLSKPQYLPSQQKASKKSNNNQREEDDVAVVKSGLKCNGKYHYIPRYGRKEEFNEMVISRSMLTDHSPWDLFKEIQKLDKGSILGALTRD